MRGGHFHRSWNEVPEEIEKCQNISPFSASSAKCIRPNRLFESRPQSNFVGAGLRRWYVSIEMRIFLVALHASSSIHLFCFTLLFRQSCYHAHQRDRSPAGHPLSLDSCWGAGTNSWPHCDELVLLVFIFMYCFLFLVWLVVH